MNAFLRGLVLDIEEGKVPEEVGCVVACMGV